VVDTAPIPSGVGTPEGGDALGGTLGVEGNDEYVADLEGMSVGDEVGGGLGVEGVGEGVPAEGSLIDEAAEEQRTPSPPPSLLPLFPVSLVCPLKPLQELCREKAGVNITSGMCG